MKVANKPVCTCVHNVYVLACIIIDIEKELEFRKFIDELKAIYSGPLPGEQSTLRAGKYFHNVCS